MTESGNLIGYKVVLVTITKIYSGKFSNGSLHVLALFRRPSNDRIQLQTSYLYLTNYGSFVYLDTVIDEYIIATFNDGVYGHETDDYVYSNT